MTAAATDNRAPDLPAALWCRSMLERRRAGMPRRLQPCWSCCCLVSGAKPCLPLQREDAATQPPVCDCLCGAAVRMPSLSAACLHCPLCRLLLVDRSRNHKWTSAVSHCQWCACAPPDSTISAGLNPLCMPAVGAESTEMAKATERVLRSVIAASCSTEGQIIEIKWVHCCTVPCSLKWVHKSICGAAKLTFSKGSCHAACEH